MYTLEQLAHFDRCLFPDDFKKQLEKAGMPEHDALMVVQYMQRKRDSDLPVGIIHLYQEFIMDEDLTKVFDAVVSEFVDRYWK
jgi:hypothetical protein